MSLQRTTLLVLGLVFSLSGTASAATISWNVASGTWNTAGNWDLNRVPAGVTPFDDVKITNGGTATLNTNGFFNTLEIGSGSKIQNTSSGSYYLRASSTTAGITHIKNAGTITTSANALSLYHQSSNYLLTIDNTGGTISATGSGVLTLRDDPYSITGGQLNIGTVARLDQYKDMTLTDVAVANTGTWDSRTINNEASSSVTLAGTASFNNTGALTIFNGSNLTTDPPRYTRLVVNSTAALTNAATGVINITRDQATTLNVKDHQAYLQMDATGFNNLGAINITSTAGQVGKAQFRAPSVGFSNAGTITVDGPNSSIQMSGMTLTQTAGLLEFKNGGSINAGTININGGTLKYSSSDAVANGVAVTVNGATAVLSLGTYNDTVSTVTLDGGGQITGSGGILTSTGTFEMKSGSLSAILGGSGVTLTKTTAGTVTLSGANTYTGLTTVTAGTLIINGDQSGATGAVTVAAEATLGGSGTIGGAVSISGNHAPGNSPGLQTFLDDLTYNAGATVAWELIGNSTAGRGATYDGINVGDALGDDLTFNGFSTTMDLSFNGTGSSVLWSDTFWDASHTGSNGWLVYDVAGMTNGFSNFNLAVSNWPDSGGNLFDTVRAGSSFSLATVGSDVYLEYNYTFIPEPASLALFALAVLALSARRRRQGTRG